MLNSYAISYSEWCNLFCYLPSYELPTAGSGINTFYSLVSNIPNNIYYIRKAVPQRFIATELCYEEVSPMSNLIALTPKQYLFFNFMPSNIWKASKICEHSVDKILTMTDTKYLATNIVETYYLPDNYIFFAISSITLNTKTIIQVIKWATENKKYVVFKDHPYPVDSVRAKDYWHLFKPILSEYTILLDQGDLNTLINNADCVWVYESGVGIKALLSGKRIAYFYPGTFSNLVGVSRTPEEAFIQQMPNKEDIYRYLSWLYTKVVIDTTDPNAGDILNQRINTFYRLNKQTITEFLL